MHYSPTYGQAFGLYLLRHGQSEANVQRLIASTPDAAKNAFGLTDAGRIQVRQSVTAARDKGVLPVQCMIVASPLLRARESATIAAEVLGAPLRLDARLSERGFGELELGSDDAYEQVWAEDRADPAHEKWGVESAAAVLDRVASLLGDLRELQRSGEATSFVLCTHGDVASILVCASQGLPLTRHREVGAMGNAEVRRISLTTLSGLSQFRNV